MFKNIKPKEKAQIMKIAHINKSAELENIY